MKTQPLTYLPALYVILHAVSSETRLTTHFPGAKLACYVTATLILLRVWWTQYLHWQQENHNE